MHSIKWDHVINLPQDPEVVEDFPELFSVKKGQKSLQKLWFKNYEKKNLEKKKTQEKEKLKEKIKKKK